MMKNGFLFFVGLFAAMAVSWGAIVLGAHRQIGNLAPYYDEANEATAPARQPGIGARGQLVYADLGCASCHTQQVRRPDFGSDSARGWGDRQSVARDYIFQSRPQLGDSRIGPDLTNLAGRKPSAPTDADLMSLLYAGSPTHPAYSFLFDVRKAVGEVPDDAMALTTKYKPETGMIIVPTERARSLVYFLQSLNNVSDYPEARPAAHPENKEEKPAAPAGQAPGAKQEAQTTKPPMKEGQK